MCGIAGIVDFAGRNIEPEKIVTMAVTQAHRGPDGEGVVFFNSDGNLARFDALSKAATSTETRGAIAALAHRRLAIIDLSDLGAQPMSDSSGSLWITYNGEIYNYVELKSQLEQKGHKFRSSSDTEVILTAYREWGADCLQRLNGMFAFAIWDIGRRRLFCARDRLGIKPFYYSFYKERLLFASEQKAILAGLDDRPSPNLSAMAEFLDFSYVLSTETMFQGIQQLAPGNWLIADKNGVTVQSYWNPVFDPAPPQDEQQWADELRALLDDSVRMQIRSDVPVGAHLSGGIDSSSICCLAARHLPKLLTFTASFDEGGFFDETPYARLVANHIGSESREIVPKGTQLEELLPKIVYHLDEPVEAASVFGKYHVAEIVSHSVKVVLGGQGGDELFGGYDWYIKSLFTAACFGASSEQIGQNKWNLLRDSLKHESIKRLGKSLWKNLGDNRLDHIFCKSWSRLNPPQLEKLFNHEVTKDYKLSPNQQFLSSFSQLQEQHPADRMFKFDLQHYLQALLTSEDRLSMAFSVESRVPMLDHRIVELAGRLGAQLKTKPGSSKHILRLAMKNIVPDEILARRDKRGFPTPIGKWLRDPKLNLLDTFVFSDNAFAEHYFDLNHIRRLSKSRTFFSSDGSERLWRLLNLCVWGKVFNIT